MEDLGGTRASESCRKKGQWGWSSVCGMIRSAEEEALSREPAGCSWWPCLFPLILEKLLKLDPKAGFVEGRPLGNAQELYS